MLPVHPEKRARMRLVRDLIEIIALGKPQEGLRRRKVSLRKSLSRVGLPGSRSLVAATSLSDSISSAAL